MSSAKKSYSANRPIGTSQDARPSSPEHEQRHMPPSSKTKRMIQATGKGLYRASGVDAIVHSTRFMKPRNPAIWSDVFSKEALKKALTHNNEEKVRKGGIKDWLALASCSLIGFLITSYALAVIAAHPAPSSVPLINKVVLLVMIVFGAAVSVIYLAAIVIRGIRIMKSRPQQKPDSGSNLR